MMDALMNRFYEAWQYLANQPVFVRCQSKNTKVAVWLECGTKGDHDIDLDCGGDSFEEVIIQLAELVKKKYDE